MTTISIHQPAYIPWLGYFDKIAKSDIHVFLDDVEYSKNNLFNRNKIKTPAGEQWLTIPVKYKSDNLICETKIDNSVDWQKKHWKTIKLNYTRAPYFKQYEEVFAEIYSKPWKYLAEINIEMNKAIAEILGIKVKFVKSSELNVKGMKNEKLINLCKILEADTYLSGQGAKSMEINPYNKPYLDENLFLKNNIKVSYQEFHYPEHHQPWGKFIPNLSIIDMLFNCGSENSQFLTKN